MAGRLIIINRVVFGAKILRFYDHFLFRSRRRRGALIFFFFLHTKLYREYIIFHGITKSLSLSLSPTPRSRPSPSLSVRAIGYRPNKVARPAVSTPRSRFCWLPRRIIRRPRALALVRVSRAHENSYFVRAHGKYTLSGSSNCTRPFKTISNQTFSIRRFITV